MKNGSQYGLLLLQRYLYKRTDDKHPASVSDILAFWQEHGIRAGRKSVYSAIEVLQSSGKGTDYEVSNAHYDSADAGQKKTVSFTIELKNAGYVFEDGTTQKDFTLNGADFDDKTFQINKAAPPMNIPTDTLNVINGTQQTYTYDFSKLLPEAPNGDYGTVRYDLGESADCYQLHRSWILSRPGDSGI